MTYKHIKYAIGDKVLTAEMHSSIPNGLCWWESIIVRIESNYIETTFCRDRELNWLKELVKKLAPNHRTYLQQVQKNYYNPITKEINVKPIA